MKERAESRKYTPAQEAARSRAAESIRQQHSGWWGGFASAVNDAWAGVVDAAGGAGGSGGGSSTDAEVSTLSVPNFFRVEQTSILVHFAAAASLESLASALHLCLAVVGTAGVFYLCRAKCGVVVCPPI